MSLLSSIKSLVFPDSGMVCPRCEKPLEGHDEAACERRMSRRYFFGVTAGAVAAVAGAALLPESGIAIAHGGATLQEFVVTSVFESGVTLTLSMDAFAEKYIWPTAKQIADEIDRDVLSLQPTLWTVNRPVLQPGDRFTMAGVYER